MPGLSKVIVLDPDVRAGRQIQLGFQREGVPAEVAEVPRDTAQLALPGEEPGLVVVGGTDGPGLDLVRQTRRVLDDGGIDAPIVFAGRGVRRTDAEAAGADEVVLAPAYLRDIVTIGRLLRGQPSTHRAHLVGSLAETTGVLTLVRALSALGRSAMLTLIRGLRRGEIRFYHGEVTSAHVGMIHGQAALHQLLLWTDARFDFHHEDIVRRHQIPLERDELFADAERFLAGVRDSSGKLSPSMVLEQNVQRIQSLGRQIPTEVHGVLRMFDGHRVLADVLEDSPYRVFETLRVAQLAVEAGLLRQTATPRPRATWRAVLALEEWLVGAETREEVLERNADNDSGAVPSAVADTASDRTGKVKGSKKKRKKQRTPGPVAGVAGAAGAAGKPEINWGSLVPRIIGAEVGPLAGVVPASHASGEITTMTSRDEPREKLEALDTRQRGRIFPMEGRAEPSVVWDEAAELARIERERAEAAEAAKAAKVEAEARAERERAEAAAQAEEMAAKAEQDARAERERAETAAKIEAEARAEREAAAEAKAQEVAAKAEQDARAERERAEAAAKAEVEARTERERTEAAKAEEVAAKAEEEARAERERVEAAAKAEEVAAKAEEEARAERERVEATAKAEADARAEREAAAKAEEAAAKAEADARAERERVEAAAKAEEEARAERERAEAAQRVEADARAERERAEAAAKAEADARAERERAEVAAKAEADARAERERAEVAAKAEADARAQREAAELASRLAEAAAPSAAAAGETAEERARRDAEETAQLEAMYRAEAEAEAAAKAEVEEAAEVVEATSAETTRIRRRAAVFSAVESSGEPASAMDLVKQLALDQDAGIYAPGAPTEPMAAVMPVESGPIAVETAPPAIAVETAPPAIAAETAGPDLASPAPVAAEQVRDTAPIVTSELAPTASGELRAVRGAAPLEIDDASERPTAPMAVARPSGRAATVELPPVIVELTRVILEIPPQDLDRSAAPSETLDEPSDGIIRQTIASAETVPSSRRPPSSIPVDDRPEDATGEIHSITGQQAAVEPTEVGEPSILVADLAAVHTAVSAIAMPQAGAPPTPSIATPAHAKIIAAVRDDATTSFSDVEEDFFRAGQEKTVRPPSHNESFDDLDEGYRPVGFWDRLLGRKPKR